MFPVVFRHSLPGLAEVVTKKETRLRAVASASSVCSEIGIDILEKGGNAADAVSPLEF